MYTVQRGREEGGRYREEKRYGGEEGMYIGSYGEGGHTYSGKGMRLGMYIGRCGEGGVYVQWEREEVGHVHCTERKGGGGQV